MELISGKGQKRLINKTWKRWRGGGGGGRGGNGEVAEKKERHAKKRGVAAQGCLPVYVGPQKQRFVMKTEYANHPLFRVLLEEAALEYGYDSQGPLRLPCNACVFYKVLLQIYMDHEEPSMPRGCMHFRCF